MYSIYGKQHEVMDVVPTRSTTARRRLSHARGSLCSKRGVREGCGVAPRGTKSYAVPTNFQGEDIILNFT